LKNDDAKRPYITLLIILLIHEYFGCHSDGRATISFHHELLILNLLSKAKIGKFDGKILLKEYIGQFDIPMNNAFGVYFLDGIPNAKDDFLYGLLWD
jgi:hypothetical protein